MGKRSLEEMVSKEDNTMQDSMIHDNYDGNDNGDKETTTSSNNDDPMVRRLSVCMLHYLYVAPIVRIIMKVIHLLYLNSQQQNTPIFHALSWH